MIIETKEGLTLLEGARGEKSLFIDSSRIDECIAYLHAHKLRHVTISPYHGYNVRNVDFLLSLKDYIEGLTFLSEKYDYTVVEQLHMLKFLSIRDNGEDTIDLANFSKLEGLSCDYTVRLKGLGGCKSLKHLTVTGLKSKDLSDFPHLSSLEDLKLFKASIVSLEGVGWQNKLREFSVYAAPKLEDIKGLTELRQLEELEIENCKRIRDYVELGNIVSLKKIILTNSGKIESLSFIQKLSRLNFISFWGTNVLDGNLSYCENISYVGFDDKKHYSHSMKQFKARPAHAS